MIYERGEEEMQRIELDNMKDYLFLPFNKYVNYLPSNKRWLDNITKPCKFFINIEKDNKCSGGGSVLFDEKTYLNKYLKYKIKYNNLKKQLKQYTSKNM
jgi:hypothetical protein